MFGIRRNNDWICPNCGGKCGNSSKPDDWKCIGCSEMNVASRDKCYKCSKSKVDGPSGDYRVCASCNEVNFSSQAVCHKCGSASF